MTHSPISRRTTMIGATSLIALGAEPARAQGARIADFTTGTAPGWRYVSDRVMGGVSDGQMQMARQAGDRFARLSGTVSTANNGGFLQMRTRLDEPFPEAAAGLRLRVRGNGETYYVHLRPRSSLRPWQYFAAPFETSGDWQEISLPWSAFSAKGGLDVAFDQTRIASMGVVAFGADYAAQLDVAWIALL